MTSSTNYWNHTITFTLSILSAFNLCANPCLASSNAADSAPISWPNFRNGTLNSGIAQVAVKDLSDKFKNRELKEFKTNGLIWATPILDEKGNTYFGSANKSFYSLDSNGNERWSYTVFDRADSLIDSAAALVPNTNLVVLPGGDGFLHALDRTTGQAAWTFHAYHSNNATHQTGTIVNSFEGNVQVNPNGLIYAGSDNGYMYAVNSSGHEVWSLRTDMMIWSSPTFSPDNRWMAFGSLDGHLYLVDPMTGTQLSPPFKAGADIKSSPTTDGEGNIYFGTSGGLFYSVHTKPEKGKNPFHLKKNWKFQADGEIYSSPALKNGKVVFGSLDGRLYCLGLDGKLLWKFAIYSPISSSPIITEDNVVLFGAKNGKLYAVDLNTGERIWSYRSTSATIKANLDSSPSLDTSGMIHVGSYGGSLYLIPYEYCETHTSDSRCEFGGKTDLPNFVENSLTTVRLASEPLMDIGAPVQVQLVAFEKGEYMDRAAIDATANLISVKITPTVEFKTEISSDGKFLNIIPKTFFAPGVNYHAEVAGHYFIKTRSWFDDRFKFFGKEFKGSIDFSTKTPKNDLLNRATPETTLTWGLKSFYLQQPAALDTYIPAALEGQAFIATAFNFNASNPKDKKALIVVIPALPRAEGFKVLAEPSKVFTLDGSYQDDNVKGLGEFRIAAMGGDITFSPLTFSMSIDPSGEEVDGRFNALSSCLKINGNGSKYSFPSLMVNQVCDPWLNVVALGTFHGKTIHNQDIVLNPIAGEILSLNHSKGDKLDLRLHLTAKDSATISEPHLLTWVEYKSDIGKITSHGSIVIDPDKIDASGNWGTEFKAGNNFLLFLDAELLK